LKKKVPSTTTTRTVMQLLVYFSFWKRKGIKY